MSDNRAKVGSILLKIHGKTKQIFLHDFAAFSGQNEDTGLYRVRIDGCWHSPDRKYTAFGAAAIAEIVRQMLAGEAASPPRPDGLDKPVRVYAHWDAEGDDPGCGMVWTRTPPHLGADGHWWIWVDGPRCVRCEDVRILDRVRDRAEIMKWRNQGTDCSGPQRIE